MLKKVLISILLVLVLAAVYFYNQPETRYMLALTVKNMRLPRNIQALSTKNPCAHLAEKTECFLHFFRANGSVEFSGDPPLFMAAMFTICEKKLTCVLELSDQMFQTIDFNNFWLRKSKFSNSKFAKEMMQVEMKNTDTLLRNFRKRLMTDFAIEQEPARKRLIVEYVKNVDSKLIELGLAN